MGILTMSDELPPFIPYPRFLLEQPLNETARLVYCLILSRLQLSKSNGWQDPDGRVYCRYPIKQLAADCHRGKTAIITALSELEKRELLKRRREGMGKANKLYLCIPDSSTSDDRQTEPVMTGKPVYRMAGKPVPNNKKNKKKEINNYDYKGDSL